MVEIFEIGPRFSRKKYCGSLATLAAGTRRRKAVSVPFVYLSGEHSGPLSVSTLSTKKGNTIISHDRRFRGEEGQDLKCGTFI